MRYAGADAGAHARMHADALHLMRRCEVPRGVPGPIAGEKRRRNETTRRRPARPLDRAQKARGSASAPTRKSPTPARMHARMRTHYAHTQRDLDGALQGVDGLAEVLGHCEVLGVLLLAHARRLRLLGGQLRDLGLESLDLLSGRLCFLS